uniref:Reverse transcriptase domain-containing protein n=1 Tax=Tanacetum cinerariifolium TaxID=118510 RepID=A0A6L2P703_TANCI|nr:reverse transcriptase domain-containing protein [Tanacetum cinerariifolium]
MASGKLAHLVKDIHRNNQHNRNQGKNSVKVINMIREEGSHKRHFEKGRSGLINKLTFLAIPSSQLTDKPIILEGIIEGDQVRRILVVRGSSSEIMYKHCLRNLNVNIRSRLRRCRTLMIGRTRMRSLRAVGSTIYTMIKFPTNQGVVTMETSKEAIQESKHLERVQDMWKETQWCQREEQMSRIREQVILKTKNNSKRGPDSGSVSPEKTWGREDAKEVFTIDHERPDLYVTMGAILTTNCKQLLADVLRENMEEGEELASLIGYPYKCFLRLLKEYSQIRMAEDDEWKIGFRIGEGLYCFTHMPKEKKSAATL